MEQFVVLIPECLDLCDGDRPLRSIRDRSAGFQISLGDPHTARPRLVAHLRFQPPRGGRSFRHDLQELLFLLGRRRLVDGVLGACSSAHHAKQFEPWYAPVRAALRLRNGFAMPFMIRTVSYFLRSNVTSNERSLNTSSPVI